MGKKIVINSGCTACGLCMASPFIEELPDGKAGVKRGGILTDKEEASFKELMENCPAKVISLENVIVKSKEEILKSIDHKIAEFKLKAPERKDLLFDSKYMDFQVPGYVHGEERYEYSSYGSAKSAARDAIDKAMYSQRRMIIQNIINNYSMDKLSPYARYDTSEKNFYYSANKKAESILKEAIQEIQLAAPNKKISAELSVIQSRPEFNKYGYAKLITEHLSDYADSIIRDGMSGQYYNLSDYVDDCDIDDTEVYAGKGLFGNDKYTTKYCFRHTKAAFEEIANDIRSACSSYFDEDIVDQVVLGCVVQLAKDYEKLLQDELKKKVNELKKLL